MLKKTLLILLVGGILGMLFFAQRGYAAAPFQWLDYATIKKSGSDTIFKWKTYHIDAGLFTSDDAYVVYSDNASCPSYLVFYSYLDGSDFNSDSLSEDALSLGLFQMPQKDINNVAQYFENGRRADGNCKFKPGNNYDLFNDSGWQNGLEAGVYHAGTNIDNANRSKHSLYKQGNSIIHANINSVQFNKSSGNTYTSRERNDEGCFDSFQLDSANANTGTLSINGGENCNPEFTVRGFLGNIKTLTDGGAPPPDASGQATGEEEPCNAGALSWIVCGTISVIQQASETFINDIIKPFLQISPLQAEAGDPIFDSWKGLRNLANVLLIPVFFFIIFSQAVSLNIDAYTIKKMLPRLVTGVLLIQFSFYIVAFLVDAFNILGNGIGDLIAGAAQGGEFGGIRFRFNDGQSVVAGLAIITGIIVAIPFALTVFGFLVVLFLALLATVATLIFRQVLIVMLAVLAPIALVAWVLPNTEKLTKLWFENLLKVLAMYPLIVILFAAATLGASIFGARPSSAGIESNLQTLAALVLAAIPFAAVPFTFKFGGAAMAGIGGAINNLRGQGVGKIKEARGKPAKPGSFRERRQQYRQRTAAGATRLSRVPGAKVMSREGIGFGRGPSSRAEVQMAKNIGTAQKELQEAQFNNAHLRALALGSERNIRNAQAQMREAGNEREANELDEVLQGESWRTISALAGRGEYRAAAAQQLADYKSATEIDYNAARGAVSGNPTLQARVGDAVKNKMAFEAKQKSAIAWGLEGEARSNALLKQAQSMTSEDIATARDWGAFAGEGGAFDRLTDPSSSNYDPAFVGKLQSALGSLSPASAKRMSEIKEILGDRHPHKSETPTQKVEITNPPRRPGPGTGPGRT